MFQPLVVVATNTKCARIEKEAEARHEAAEASPPAFYNQNVRLGSRRTMAHKHSHLGLCTRAHVCTRAWFVDGRGRSKGEGGGGTTRGSRGKPPRLL